MNNIILSLLLLFTTCSPAMAWTTNAPSSIRRGMIVMWSGTIATIPTGWVLCDGSNSTPDLRNKFIVAADADSGGAAKSTISGSATQSGGASTINIAHTHTVTRSGYGVTIFGSGASEGDIGAASNQGNDFSAQAISTDLTTSSSGSATQSILNPYYVLAFIMKT